jgi:hypothetical protein
MYTYMYIYFSICIYMYTFKPGVVVHSAFMVRNVPGFFKHLQTNTPTWVILSCDVHIPRWVTLSGDAYIPTKNDPLGDVYIPTWNCPLVVLNVLLCFKNPGNLGTMNALCTTTPGLSLAHEEEWAGVGGGVEHGALRGCIGWASVG